MTGPDPLDEIEAHAVDWGRKSAVLARLSFAVSVVAIGINVLSIYRGGAWWNYAAVVWLSGLAVADGRSHFRYVRHRDETLLWVARRRMERDGR